MKKLLFFILLSHLFCSAQIKTYYGNKVSIQFFENKIKKVMDSLQIPGMSVAIINNGKIAYNRGFGFSDIKQRKQATNQTFFEAASLSKPVFSYFVLKLAHEGKLNLDKPLYQYLPADNISDERYKKITARMVLSHTTGLPNWSEITPIPLLFNPGEKFSYSGEAFVYLAKVIAKITKTNFQNLEQLFQQKVAQKLGLKNFHFVITKEAEYNQATGYQNRQQVKDIRDRTIFDPAGGLYANTSNYAQFLIKLIKQKKVYKEMFMPISHLDDNDPIKKYFGIQNWTLGLAVIKIKNSINYWHGGNNLGFTSSFIINPEKEFGYVFFTNADQCNDMKKVFEDILWR
ncbi:serine hydrolase domain-containing protein [Elizabethkingia anophelis]|uniref:Beta-lactamase-related domain-containing protein n=2 Tax=Elizabethkingia anophelis TaxID=1117645 RepID=A0AAU8UYA3_9FLAO|nr:serine hydrolase domain-containing protein [Elizabethkingia anophelis]AQX02152.1 hypothetical protein BBD32_12080 [Elizabethkingia anophelis]MDV3753540.1 hypothetical protein [Elizabethkingia anophelis]MYY49224.1 class A beta-lactamase-related serine hydrolase [Elizabethkingia anophelis]OPB63956.1 hypothetical protein BAY11_16465 [Elizabethkingia anophelis]